MKIAFIVAEFPKLSETFILNQITGLIDRGHEIDIFAEIPGESSRMHEDVYKYNLIERTYYLKEINDMIPKNKLLRIIKSIVYILVYIRKKPKPVLNSLNFFKYGKRAASLCLLFDIMPFLEKGTYDIIHAHFGPNGNFGIFLKDLRAVEGKVLTTFHGYDLSSYLKNNGDSVYNDLFAKGDLFLPISEYWKDKLIDLGCSREKIVVHRMGVDVSKFKFISRMPRKNGKVQLLTIARLVEKKGTEYGIKAVSEVLKRYSNIEYIIIGDGPLKGSLEGLVEDLRIVDNVKFYGWMEQERIVEFMQEADILLAPSVTGKNGDREGIPVVLMEALAQGLPVISTQHSGIPELVQDEISGFLVPEHDTDALAQRLLYLIEHPEIWPEMGRAGTRNIEENHNITKLNDRLVEIYQRILN